MPLRKSSRKSLPLKLNCVEGLLDLPLKLA